MITKEIQKKINTRESLLAGYQQDLVDLGEKLAKVEADVNTAIDAGDFKRGAQLERELTATKQEIADVNKAIGWATEKLAIPRKFIVEQWRERETDHKAKVDKAQAKADKAFNAFVDSLKELRAFTEAAREELDEYNELARAEDRGPDSTKAWSRFRMSIENVPVEALYTSCMQRI